MPQIPLLAVWAIHNSPFRVFVSFQNSHLYCLSASAPFAASQLEIVSQSISEVFTNLADKQMTLKSDLLSFRYLWRFFKFGQACAFESNKIARVTNLSLHIEYGKCWQLRWQSSPCLLHAAQSPGGRISGSFQVPPWNLLHRLDWCQSWSDARNSLSASGQSCPAEQFRSISAARPTLPHEALLGVQKALSKMDRYCRIYDADSCVTKMTTSMLCLRLDVLIHDAYDKVVMPAYLFAFCNAQQYADRWCCFVTDTHIRSIARAQ